jgi:hypothetical protein
MVGVGLPAVRAFVGGHWLPVRDGDSRVVGLWRRHYTWKGRRPDRSGPGEKLVLLTADGRAVWIWRYERYRRDGQTGVCCALFRNEGPILSSELVREATQIALRRWPGQRLFTFVNPAIVRSPNPGYCYLQAGWRRYGVSAGGLHILEYV